MQNILGGGISGHVTTTSAIVTVIKDSFNLFQGQASVEHGIDSDTVQGISYNAVWLRLMPNRTSGLLCQFILECVCLKIHDNVTVPWITSVDNKKCFIRDMILGLGWNGVCRERENKISKKQ